jgi:hypothetical protein
MSNSKKNNQAYKAKARKWKRRTGGTDYTAFLAGGGNPNRNVVGTMGRQRMQQTQAKGAKLLKAQRNATAADVKRSDAQYRSTGSTSEARSRPKASTSSRGAKGSTQGRTRSATAADIARSDAQYRSSGGRTGVGRRTSTPSKPSRSSSSTPSTRPSSTRSSRSSSTPSSASQSKGTKKNASTYMEHGSKLHRGRYKTLAEHRAAVAKQKQKASAASGEGRQALSMSDKKKKK